MTHAASLSRYTGAFSVLEVTESNELETFLGPPSINSLQVKWYLFQMPLIKPMIIRKLDLDSREMC